MRFLSIDDRVRRGCAFALIIIFSLGAGISLLISVAEASAGTGCMAFVLGIPILVAFYLLFFPNEQLRVDFATRTATHKVGKTEKTIPFDALGPLFMREIVTRSSKSVSYRYRIESAAVPSILFYENHDESRARTEMESIARKLGVGVRSRTGDERGVTELDLPYFERKAKDKEILEAPPAKSKTLSVSSEADLVVIRSSHIAILPIIGAGFILMFGMGFFSFFGMAIFHEPQRFFRPRGFEDYMLIGLAALFLLGISSAVIPMLIEAFYPRRITVTPETLQYRFTEVPLEQIEEIDNPAGPTRLITDRRIVRISRYFCPVDDYEPLYQEVRKAVVTMGRARRLRAMLGIEP